MRISLDYSQVIFAWQKRVDFQNLIVVRNTRFSAIFFEKILRTKVMMSQYFPDLRFFIPAKNETSSAFLSEGRICCSKKELYTTPWKKFLHLKLGLPSWHSLRTCFYWFGREIKQAGFGKKSNPQTAKKRDNMDDWPIFDVGTFCFYLYRFS